MLRGACNGARLGNMSTFYVTVRVLVEDASTADSATECVLEALRGSCLESVDVEDVESPEDVEAL